MAGYRRKTGRPKKRVSSAQRRRDKMISELQLATTSDERLEIAIRYVRSCMAGSTSTMAKEDLVAHLIEVGDRVLEQRLRPQDGGTS